MKNLLFIALLSVGLFSCGSDDDCLADDFVGSWTGIVTCTGDEDVTETTTFEITKVSDNEIGLDGTTLDVSGCKASGTFTDPFFGSESDIDLELDGETLKIKQTTSVFGISVDCEGELTK